MSSRYFRTFDLAALICFKILLESQVNEKPIAYTKWEKCLKKDRMHTLTCITQTLFFTFNYLVT
jgi:hypothetical protein